MQSFTDNIANSKKTCYFISPHLDDAAYSAGALIGKLSKSNKVVVVNVFTSSGSSISGRWAKIFLNKCNYTDPKAFFAEREAEDLAALSPITSEVINLGFTDAAWRQKTSNLYRWLCKLSPEFSAMYPTIRLRLLPGKLSRADHINVDAVKKKLSETVDKNNSIIFCPLALGNHIDHVVVRMVCDEIFNNVIHWSDYPYNTKNKVDDIDKNLEVIKLGLDFKKKEDLVKKYASQYNAVIGENNINRLEEYYYLPPKFLNNSANNSIQTININKLRKD